MRTDIIHEHFIVPESEYQMAIDKQAARIAELELKVNELEGLAEYQCADCQDTGWLENRVEGKYPCTCMTEMEPYQLLESKIAELESDARIMARQVVLNHLKYRQNREPVRDCACPACIIAAKYK